MQHTRGKIAVMVARYVRALLAAGVVCLSGHAMAADIKSMLEAAFDAPDGRAHGYLSGAAAEPFRIMTMGEAPTELTVQIIDRRDEDCGRVRFSFMQPDALRRDGQRERLDYHMEINVCRDGSPYIHPEMQDGPRAWQVADSMRARKSMAVPRVDVPSAGRPAKPVTASKPVIASDQRSTSRSQAFQTKHPGAKQKTSR